MRPAHFRVPCALCQWIPAQGLAGMEQRQVGNSTFIETLSRNSFKEVSFWMSLNPGIYNWRVLSAKIKLWTHMINDLSTYLKHWPLSHHNWKLHYICLIPVLKAILFHVVRSKLNYIIPLNIRENWDTPQPILYLKSTNVQIILCRPLYAGPCCMQTFRFDCIHLSTCIIHELVLCAD